MLDHLGHVLLPTMLWQLLNAFLPSHPCALEILGELQRQ